MPVDQHPAPVRLGAALFNADHTRLAEEVARLDAARIDFLHLDVFDGSLVPDLAFAPRTIAALRPLTQLPFEVHLVSREMDRHLGALAEAGVDRVFFHVEGAAMVYETAFAIREHGMSPGVAVGLATAIDPVVDALPHLDAVLLLARLTGEGSRGASFHPGALGRIVRMRRLIIAQGSPLELQVAGGINRTNARDVAGSGANSLALGAGLFRVADLASELDAIRSEIQAAEASR